MGKARIIDANILLRFLTNDDPDKADQCQILLKRIEAQEEEVLLPDIILADIIWTLQSFYKQPKVRIRELIMPLLSLKGLRFSSKEVAYRALAFYVEHNIDWTDAFVAAQMIARGRAEIYSYDRDFEKIKEIKRLEP